jgi:hypothetical protein
LFCTVIISTIHQLKTPLKLYIKYSTVLLTSEFIVHSKFYLYITIRKKKKCFVLEIEVAYNSREKLCEFEFRFVTTQLSDLLFDSGTKYSLENQQAFDWSSNSLLLLS